MMLVSLLVVSAAATNSSGTACEAEVVALRREVALLRELAELPTRTWHPPDESEYASTAYNHHAHRKLLGFGITGMVGDFGERSEIEQPHLSGLACAARAKSQPDEPLTPSFVNMCAQSTRTSRCSSTSCKCWVT